MKQILNLLTLIIIMLHNHYCYGQKDSISKAELLFEKGLLMQQNVKELHLQDGIFIENSNVQLQNFVKDTKTYLLKKASKYYAEFIDSFPNSIFLYKVLWQNALVANDLGDYNLAKKMLVAFLEIQPDYKSALGSGNGVMEEPYINYQNRATTILAVLYINDSNFTEAVHYLNLSKKFQYRSFCMNDYRLNELYISELYAKCYLGLKDSNKAISILTPYILEAANSDNQVVISILTSTLLSNYTKSDLKAKFDYALKNYQAEQVIEFGEKIKKYSISFLGTKVNLPENIGLAYYPASQRLKKIVSIGKESSVYQAIIR